jgi:hypothetical protein
VAKKQRDDWLNLFSAKQANLGLTLLISIDIVSPIDILDYHVLADCRFREMR